jgi:DNA-binding CsgD family transcriptional regulator/PAS domain-containing protein
LSPRVAGIWVPTVLSSVELLQEGEDVRLEHNLLNLVGKIYECAADPLGWDDFLRDLAHFARGSIAALAYNDSRRDQHVVSAQFGITPECQRLYHEHYGTLDEWTRGAPGTAHTGWVGTGNMLVPDAVLAKSEFYNDFLRVVDGGFHQCAAVLSQEDDSWGTVTITRPRRSGPFGESQLRVLRLLLPHLQRAMQLHRKFVALRKHSNMLESSLDLVTTAIVFVDSTGHILLANRSAAALLQRCDGLLSTRDGLRTNSPRESAQLEKFIRAAALTGNGNGLSAGGAMHISRKSPRTPLAVLVAPVKLDLASLTPHAAAVIFITDPEQKVEPSGEVLRRLYGVTPAEYKLAALLAQGRSLRQAAEIRQVTIGTARIQLKSIFLKTNVSSQSQLVRLLLLLPPALHRDGLSTPNGR